MLLLPPFYYKNVSDDGLFAFVARVVERLGARPPRIVLYHIPPVAVVGWPVELMARLVEALKAAGSKPRATFYPGVGHGCWERAYGDTELPGWLLAQRKGPPPSSGAH